MGMKSTVILPKKLRLALPETEFHPGFLPYLDAPQKVQLYIGNRGSGKTKFFYQRAIINCLKPDYFRLIYCKKHSNSIRDSMFQGIKDQLKQWELTPYFQIKESEMDFICLLSGNMMLSFGLDDPEKLKGIEEATHVFWDEMMRGDFQDYASLVALLRTKKATTQFWGTFNPEYGFWGREYFFLDHESDEIPMGEVPSNLSDTLILKETFKRNPFIDPVKYENDLLELARGDQNKAIVWIDGNWGVSQTGGEFYPPFNKAVHVSKVPFLKGKAIHLAYDINAVPYVSELCSQIDITETKFQIRIFKEYCLPSPLNSVESAANAFLAEYGNEIIDLFIYGDASGNSKIAGKGNVTAYDDVRKVFRKYLSHASNRTMKTNPPVLKARDFMNNLLLGRLRYNGLIVELIIDESCKELIKDMMQVKLGVDGKVKKRITDRITGVAYEEFGHTSDALCYYCVRLLHDLFKKD